MAIHATTVSLQGKSCKDVCTFLKSKPPYRARYVNHVYCTRCDTWMLKEAMMANGRCPCCHHRPRYKSTKNRNRK